MILIPNDEFNYCPFFQERLLWTKLDQSSWLFHLLLAHQADPESVLRLPSLFSLSLVRRRIRVLCHRHCPHVDWWHYNLHLSNKKGCWLVYFIPLSHSLLTSIFSLAQNQSNLKATIQTIDKVTSISFRKDKGIALIFFYVLSGHCLSARFQYLRRHKLWRPSSRRCHRNPSSWLWNALWCCFDIRQCYW